MKYKDQVEKGFRGFILITFLILLLETAGAFFSNSLALLSDAGHVLIDFLSLVLTYFALRVSRKSASKKYTFGYHRFEILAAIINAMALVLVTIYIFYEAYNRFHYPVSVMGGRMLIVSSVGLLANLYVMIKMQGYGTKNLGIRGAYLHVLSDTLSSMGVVAAGILIILTGNFVFDLVVSFAIGIFIMFSSLRLMAESVKILMESAPNDIDLDKLKKDIEGVKGVMEVHEIHVWTLSPSMYALNSHVVIKADSIKSMNRIIRNINDMLKSRYKISHTAIQSECEDCAIKER